MKRTASLPSLGSDEVEEWEKPRFAGLVGHERRLWIMFDQINNPGIGAKKAWGERISEAAIIVAVVIAVLGSLLYFALR